MWAGSHKLATPGLLVWKPDVLAKLSSAAWQLPAFHDQSTVLTLLPTRMECPFCRSITSSVIEKRILSACWHGEPVRHGQRATLIALQRNFLCQHDVACDEMTLGRKAPTSKRTAGAVELVNVHRGAVTNPVSLSAVAAGDLKIALGVILRDLLRR